MLGVEWVVEAMGCDPGALTDPSRLAALLEQLTRELPLHPVGEPLWHRFPGAGGITGLCLLAESHFACHTYPEHGSLTINLFCCKPRPEFDFRGYLEKAFGARMVRVRKLERPYGRLLEATGT
jgi:S-adenosylmethionine decarboxylase